MSENVPVPPARTITLSGRSDGETGGNRPAIVRPGETMPFAVECIRIAGQWIDSANNITVEDVGTPSGTLDATILDVRDSLVLITIDGTDAEDGDQWTVLFDIHRTADETIKGEIEVNCEDV
jgi:hypothetical protein